MVAPFSLYYFSAMFHPDNIKNYTLDGVPVSISLHQYWQLIGGPKGLAKALHTDLKVSIKLKSKLDRMASQDHHKILRLELNSKKNYMNSVRFGNNVKRIPKIKSIWEIMLETLSDKILIILLIAATVSTILGVIQDPAHGWIDGISVYVAVVVIVSITSGNNYAKEKKF